MSFLLLMPPAPPPALEGVGASDALHAGARRVRVTFHSQLARHGERLALMEADALPREIRAFVAPAPNSELYARFTSANVALLPRPVWRVRVMADVPDGAILHRPNGARLGRILFRETRMAFGIPISDTLLVGG